MNYLVMRDSRKAVERAEELLWIADVHELPLYTRGAAFIRGWALADAGQPEEGIAEMDRIISEPSEALSTTVMFTTLAEVYGKNGRPEAGLTWWITGSRRRSKLARESSRRNSIGSRVT